MAKKVEDVLEKYKEKLAGELGEGDVVLDETPEEKKEQSQTSTKEYSEFKKEMLPAHMTLYEKYCNLSQKLLGMKNTPGKNIELEEDIKTCHLDVTPAGVQAFALLAPFVLFFVGSFVSFILLQSMFFVMFFLLFGAAMYLPLLKIPKMLATDWRMKASNQMVLCVFYIVTYMRHTSNIENAIEFASEHLDPPLSLDLRRVIWNVETEKNSSIKESMEEYLIGWRKFNMEFIEAFHLIESSLFESSEDRRVSLLDKALDVILDETYEKMLHYAQNLKNPITMLHMLGIILPILGLVILPLMVSFMEGVEWYHIAAIYNVALPIGVYYLGRNILATRPTGYGDTDVSELPSVKKKAKTKLFGIDIGLSPGMLGIVVCAIFLIIGFMPIIIGSTTPDNILLEEKPFFGNFKLLDYHYGISENADPNKLLGPFGFGASVLSLFIPLAFGFGIGLYNRLKSTNVKKIREEAKKLEQEFASALFQLGNRLGDGIPAEMAFGRVAEVMEGTTSGKFFADVDNNIRNGGMGLEEAIFDKRRGAISEYPSAIIESSMKVLIQSAEKGPMVAAQAILNVARYIKEIHRVDERLKDLMADIISGMESQIKFLTPAISGIVIGITSMITAILGQLGGQITKISAEAGSQAGALSSMFGDGVPTFFFQMVVGVYVVQLTYILTVLVNGIENGEDKVNERFMLGQYMIKSPLLYVIIAFVVMIIFNIVAVQILGATISADLTG